MTTEPEKQAAAAPNDERRRVPGRTGRGRLVGPRPRPGGPAVTDHIRLVVWGPLRRRWRARCTCGFKGPWSRERHDAAVDAAAHVLVESLVARP